MKPSFAHDQPDFERWLLTEIPVQARIHRMHKMDGRTGYAAQMTEDRLDMLIVVLGRYADRDPAALHKVAHIEAELEKLARNGPSLMARLEREAEERERWRCRGCDGTCCTGVGSEPCTCPPPPDRDDIEDGERKART